MARVLMRCLGLKRADQEVIHKIEKKYVPQEITILNMKYYGEISGGITTDIDPYDIHERAWNGENFAIRVERYHAAGDSQPTRIEMYYQNDISNPYSNATTSPVIEFWLISGGKYIQAYDGHWHYVDPNA